MPAGRPLIFPTPASMIEAWDKYKKKKEGHNDLICKENFLVETGNYIGLFAEYAKKSEFSQALEKINNDCKYYVSNRAIKGEYNAAISKLLLNHNYGIRERQEVDQTTHNINETYEEYKQRLEAERKKAKQEKRIDEDDI